MSNDQTNLLNWILTGVSVIIATLFGISTKFYQRQVADFDKKSEQFDQREEVLETHIETLRKEILECQRDRESIRVELAKVQTRLEILEQKQAISKQ